MTRPDLHPDQITARREERAIRLCLLLDVLTFLPCATVALLSGSMLLLSDGLDYARSFASQGVALRIMRSIRKGRTHSYDYGPGKVERIGSLFGALCFVAGLIVLGVFSFHRLLHPVELHAGFTAAGIALQAVSFAISGGLWRHTRRLAVQTGSPLIDMQWRHNRTDALASAAVMLALALTLIFRSRSWAGCIDPLCALAYVFYATGSYIPVIRESLYDLVDHTLDEDLQLAILRRLAEHYHGYEAFHGVRSRRAGNRIFIEITLSLDPARRIGDAIGFMETLRTAIESDIPRSEVRITLRPVSSLPETVPKSAPSR
ncbi:MAG: cation diffusion facilitator family transporter [Lentisphaerae bacterium]|nr:cation diffusion facilitator family transporter [Lentisphaerota bacterium]